MKIKTATVATLQCGEVKSKDMVFVRERRESDDRVQASGVGQVDSFVLIDDKGVYAKLKIVSPIAGRDIRWSTHGNAEIFVDVCDIVDSVYWTDHGGGCIRVLLPFTAV